jgi:outer membrane protein
MSKIFSVKLFLCGLSIVGIFGMFLFMGCAHLKGSEDYYTFKAAPETLQQIETIELKEAEEEEILTLDREEPELVELEISLEECRALTLKNNLDLKVQLINPTIAAERVSQEEARFEAAFSATAVYSKSNTPVASTIEIAGNQVDTTYADLGVNIPLRTGGDITVNLTDNRNKTDSFWAVYNPSYDSDLSASISQPLLRNAGKRVNTHAIRIAEYNRQITDARTKLEAIRVIADVDRAYWRLYAARRLLDVRRQQYELAGALFEQTERLVDIGIKPPIELIRTRAGVAERLEAIIAAENGVQNTERDLKRMLNKSGLGMETATALIPSTEPDPVRYELQKGEMVANAIENRMDMLELEMQIAQDASTIDYRRNQTLPLVTMEYRYNMNGLGPARNDSYDMLFDNMFNDHLISLQVSIPLGNRAAKSRLRQAIYERTRRLASRDNKKAQIRYDVLKQIGQLEASWQRILASRQTTILRDQQYQAEKRQYELGMLTSTDVLQAQTDLADAQRMEILALTEYQIALVDLAYATGTLLGAAKVQWEPFVPEEQY